MTELKPPCTFKQQIDKFKERGLIIENEVYAEKILSRVNYYRLSAYGLGLHENNQYKHNVTFETIYCLYEFDVRFRYLLLEAIEIIEIMFRTKIAHHLAMKYGSESYLDVNCFQSEKYHNGFVREFNNEKNRQEDTAFIKHHNTHYQGRMPVWVAVEIFSFGMLSLFYGNMKIEDQVVVAQDFNTSPAYIRSWLKCLVEVRNICAHYGRVYNRNLSSEPKLYKEHKYIRKNRIFAIILIIRRLLDDNSFQKAFILKVQALIEAYSANLNLSYIGFPENWQSLLGEYIQTK